MRRLARFLTTFYRTICITLAALVLFLGWTLGAGAQGIDETLGLGESLSYQVFHNGVPVGTGSTLVVPSASPTPDLVTIANYPPPVRVPAPAGWISLLLGGAVLAGWSRWRR